MNTPMYKALARAFDAFQRTTRDPSFPADVARSWRDTIRHVEKTALPQGSGFDAGTRFDFDASTPECLVLHTQFHHMDDNGSYDGWTSHTIRVRPSFLYDFELTINGRDRNDIKDYIYDVFSSTLRMPIDVEVLFAKYKDSVARVEGA